MKQKIWHFFTLIALICIVSSGVKGQGQYVKVNDINMYYEEYGSGEPLLLIHGATGAIEHFEMQIPELSKKFRLIIPEIRAHARTSDSEKPFRIPLMASDFIELLNALNIDSTLVVGWSLGGAIALELAVSYPDRIRKIVSIGSNYHMNGVDEDILNTFKTSAPDDFYPHIIERYKRLSPTPENWPNFLKKLQEMWTYEEVIFSESELKNILKPVLVMSGDNDFVKLEHTVSLYQLLPNSQLCIIPDAGHPAHIQRHKIVNEIIIDFLL